MCGIVGAVAQRNVQDILISGLKHLEYRGYDSAGVAISDDAGQIQRVRALGKVQALADKLSENPLNGHCGIAHTRWATHGQPSKANAHPHMSGDDLAIVHNGIIENHDELRDELKSQGYEFVSATDTEVIAHLLHQVLKSEKNFVKAVRAVAEKLKGAYSLGVMLKSQPGRLVAVRSGSPLVIGVGVNEHFIASDPLALVQVTQQFCYLEEGDLADITTESLTIYNKQDDQIERVIQDADIQHQATDLGECRHYMQKEIFEQVDAVSMTLDGRVNGVEVLLSSFGHKAKDLFSKVKHVQIVACGTSYHAGFVAKYWLESLAGIACDVEVASEFRYRPRVARPDSLLCLISQSGETADLLSVLREAREDYLTSLAICNVPMSSLTRESDCTFMTRAGAEIGVASTKAFTAQLTALALLTLSFKQLNGGEVSTLLNELKTLPSLIESALKLDDAILDVAQSFADKHHTLFLGRGDLYPIAMEGALKLKEISYIHAEAYAAGELKHGPLALVDNQMPIVACAPSGELFEKTASNLQEVKARGGQLVILTDVEDQFPDKSHTQFIHMEKVPAWLAPVVYTIPLQLLSYHVAVLKGTDVDKPRNLAKSVTVE